MRACVYQCSEGAPHSAMPEDPRWAGCTLVPKHSKLDGLVDALQLVVVHMAFRAFHDDDTWVVVRDAMVAPILSHFSVERKIRN